MFINLRFYMEKHPSDKLFLLIWKKFSFQSDILTRSDKHDFIKHVLCFIWNKSYRNYEYLDVFPECIKMNIFCDHYQLESLHNSLNTVAGISPSAAC